MNEQPLPNVPPDVPTVQPQQSVPTVQQQQPTPYSPGVPAPKKRSLLWLWITLGVFGTLAAIGAILFIFAFPGIQARATASEFMGAVAKDDEATMKKLSDSGRDGITQKATAGLKGATYTIKDSTDKGNIGYVVNFDVKNSSTLTNTTVVVKSGKVTTFNINSKGTSTGTQGIATDSATASSCLTVSDLKTAGISYIDQESLDAGTRSGNGTYLGELFFAPDSTNFLSDTAASSELDKFATVFSTNKNKQFFFMVRGSVRESASTTAGATLANERSVKIKNQLVSRGVPEDMVKLYQPVSGASMSSDDIDRRIDININVSNCNSAADGK